MLRPSGLNGNNNVAVNCTLKAGQTTWPALVVTLNAAQTLGSCSDTASATSTVNVAPRPDVTVTPPPADTVCAATGTKQLTFQVESTVPGTVALGLGFDATKVACSAASTLTVASECSKAAGMGWGALGGKQQKNGATDQPENLPALTRAHVVLWRLPRPAPC